ncbi:hypothetical protein HAX54_037654 [Datura stramonium]|uniref:Uncharacterized protein n=1 Tax=Datura stramonium TaxID=4076 RepID=A0ABS8SH56_DATST|nr:hypothetical protein [Datura stramonium]
MGREWCNEGGCRQFCSGGGDGNGKMVLRGSAMAERRERGRKMVTERGRVAAAADSGGLTREEGDKEGGLVGDGVFGREEREGGRCGGSSEVLEERGNEVDVRVLG